MDLCLEMEQRPGARVSKKWREQGFLNLVGEQAAEAEEEEDA